MPKKYPFKMNKEIAGQHKREKVVPNISISGMLEEFERLQEKHNPEELVNRIEVRHIHEFLTLCDGIGTETIHDNYSVGSFTGIPVIKNEALPNNYFKIYNNRGDIIGEGELRKKVQSGYEIRARHDMKVVVPNNPIKIEPV